MLDVDDVPGATSYRWYLDGVLKATTTSSYYHLPMSGNVSCGNFYYFGVKAVNICGASAESYVGATMPPCNSPYRVSPNPSTSNILVEPSDDNNLELSSRSVTEIRQIIIVDKMGYTKMKRNFTDGLTSVNISVTSLPNDIYTLRIFDGKNWYVHKIIVQR